MNASEIYEKSVKILVFMNAAIMNMRLYPPSSNLIINTIEKVAEGITDILNEIGSLVYAESKKTLLLCGKPLNENDQHKPQIVSFMNLMLNYGIRSISFEKGMDKSELMTFLEVITQKLDDLENEGGVIKVFESKGLQNIFLDKKVYVEMDKDK